MAGQPVNYTVSEVSHLSKKELENLHSMLEKKKAILEEIATLSMSEKALAKTTEQSKDTKVEQPQVLVEQPKKEAKEKDVIGTLTNTQDKKALKSIRDDVQKSQQKQKEEGSKKVEKGGVLNKISQLFGFGGEKS